MTGNGPSVKKNILIAPLDWGLGHATRCIPIIRKLLAKGAHVFIAAEGKTASLLSEEFPSLAILPLEGYRVQYGKNKIELVGKILLQIPKILETIQAENEWLNQVVRDHEIDIIISDNRYGLYNKNAWSVFITHQLQIKTGFSISDRILQEINYNHISNFDECWVADLAQKPGLAAQLSHPKKALPIPLHYCGPLSRFRYKRAEEKDYILVMLSGPEPQRTMLEEIFLKQINLSTGPVILLRGLPGENDIAQFESNVQCHNHLSSDELETIIAGAKLVVARCGYSTVMDMMALRKKTVLIPTPGQTEQEYLADCLMKNGYALCVNQDEFNLGEMTKRAETFEYNFPAYGEQDVLDALIEKLLSNTGKKMLHEEQA